MLTRKDEKYVYSSQTKVLESSACLALNELNVTFFLI